MQILESISYTSLPFYSKLVKDYFSRKDNLESFYHNSPNLEGLIAASNARNFEKENRLILSDAIIRQYSHLTLHEAVKTNIEKLKSENTFTVTTGHQLCSYLGPAYFIYKIASVINLTKQLNAADSSKNFIPVFWMASEDHDFDEISEVHFYGKNWKWEKESENFGKAPVGILKPGMIASWAQDMKQYFRDAEEVSAVIKIFEEAYQINSTLSNATRQIVNELFQHYGLIVIDGDDKQLKGLFIPTLIKEVQEKCTYPALNATTGELMKLGYEGQINAREINLFYFNNDNLRLRIESSGNNFKIHDSEKSFTKEEIIAEINSHPERFSPNVSLRPVYQETILPNIAYIGGPAEVAYWLQLKEVFKNFQIDYPVVLVRNSFAVLQNSVAEKVKGYGISWEDFFNKSIEELSSRYVRSNNDEVLNFEDEKQLLKQMIIGLNKKAEQIDKNLLVPLSIEEKNLNESLDKLESKFNKSLKQKSESEIKNIQRIKSALFPQNVSQERFINFLSLFDFKSNSLEELISFANPLENGLKVIGN